MGEGNMNEWLEKRGWEENPFNFKIYPGLLVGYEQEISTLLESVEARNKFVVVAGETGAGKTNLLKWLTTRYEDERDVYYMPKPPTTNDDLLEYLCEEVLQPGWLSRLFSSYSLYSIQDELDEALDEPTVLIVDEGHEASLDVLKWIRTAIDHIDNLTVIAAGLPEFVETLEGEVHTLYSRATNILELDSLDRDETVELIRSRIEEAGGGSLEPFTQDALLEIYSHTGGFPREVLRACNKCVLHASREDMSIVNEDDVKDILTEEGENEDEDEDVQEEAEENTVDVNLTPKQEKVVSVLEEHGACSSGEVADTMGTEEYTSRSHAVRSINNILKRLMENGLVDRERSGRSYEYFLEQD
jgi:type II secretory pathway predicted ATPase ExeA